MFPGRKREKGPRRNFLREKPTSPTFTLNFSPRKPGGTPQGPPCAFFALLILEVPFALHRRTPKSAKHIGARNRLLVYSSVRRFPSVSLKKKWKPATASLLAVVGQSRGRLRPGLHPPGSRTPATSCGRSPASLPAMRDPGPRSDRYLVSSASNKTAQWASSSVPMPGPTNVPAQPGAIRGPGL